MLVISETLILGVDIAYNRDDSHMTVSRKVGSQVVVTNEFTGKEAEELYTKLLKGVKE